MRMTRKLFAKQDEEFDSEWPHFRETGKKRGHSGTDSEEGEAYKVLGGTVHPGGGDGADIRAVY